MDGIINVNKPRGRTSFGVVAMVRRLSGERRVGHTGTLDPDAAGVLPVCVGRATRVVEYLMDDTKAYRAEIELGLTTDSYDASGVVTQRRDPFGVGREQFERALDAFRGRIQQTPPMFSAVKHQGTPLYRLARAGVTVARSSRTVEVSRLEVAAWRPPVVTIGVECSKGTYVRSLVHDLGQVLGCGASLRDLVRLRCGLFCIEDAIAVPELEEAFRQGSIGAHLHPSDSVLAHWPAVVVDEGAAAAIRNGRPLDLETVPGEAGPEVAAQDSCHALDGLFRRAYAQDGSFLAILRFDVARHRWRPRKVFV